MKFLHTLTALAALILGTNQLLAGGDSLLGNAIVNHGVTVSNPQLAYRTSLSNGGLASRIDVNLSFINSANQLVTVKGLPTFCTDLHQGISLGANYVNTYTAIPAVANQFPVGGVSSLTNPARFLALQYLYGNTFGTAENYFTQIASWQNYKLTAFQIALWEIVADDYKNTAGLYEFNLATGSMNKNNSSDVNMRPFADNLLLSVRNSIANSQGTKMDLIVLASPNYQDLIIPYTPVPEPSTYALAGAASLLGLAAYRRRAAAKARNT